MRTASKVKSTLSTRKEGSCSNDVSNLANGRAKLVGQETVKEAEERWERSKRKGDRDRFRMREWGNRARFRRAKNGLGSIIIVSTLTCKKESRWKAREATEGSRESQWRVCFAMKASTLSRGQKNFKGLRV